MAALTATATSSTRTIIFKSLEMKGYHVVNKILNIKFSVWQRGSHMQGPNHPVSLAEAFKDLIKYHDKSPTNIESIVQSAVESTVHLLKICNMDIN